MSKRLLVAALLALIFFAPASSRAQEGGDASAMVVVSGAGTVSAPPDSAQVRAGVVTNAPSASAAVEANSQSMERVLQALTSAAVPSKDIQTESLTVQPRYGEGSQGRRENEIVGYEVTNRLRVTIRDIERLGAIVDDLVRQGANQLYGIRFSVREPTRFLDDARQRAMADARRKAELYAQAAGGRLGRPLRIEEGGPPVAPMVRSMAAEGAVPVQPGELEFAAQVTVTYAMESR